MTDHASTTQWINLAECDDPRDIEHQAVAQLARGGVVGLGFETQPHLVCSALAADAVAAVRRLAGSAEDQEVRPTILLKGFDELADWVAPVPEPAARLARRLWPGPLTLVFPNAAGRGVFDRLPDEVKPRIAPRGELALGSPASPMIQRVLRLCPGPLVAAPTPRLEPRAGLDLVVDSGPAPLDAPATVVRLDDEGRWAIQREGAIDAATIRQMSGTIILFICTGNTCRSPMAEGLCKVLLARRLNCSIDELEDRGYVVQSAGVAARHGAPAAVHAAEILRQRGGSLENHRSQPADIAMARRADLLFAMTLDHLETLLDAAPELLPRAHLLDPDGGDVLDPIGADLPVYHQTAELIEAMLHRRLDQIGVPNSPRNS